MGSLVSGRDVTRYDPAAEAAARAADNVAREVALSKWRRAHTAGFGSCYCAAMEGADGHCLHCRAFRDGWAGETSIAAMFSDDMRAAINAGRRARRAYERQRQAGAS